MMVGIGGLLGSGKTLLCTLLGYNFYLKKKWRMLSNYKTSFTELINPLELLNFDVTNSVFLGDEIYTILESRQSASELNRLLSYLIFQSRKRDFHVIYTAQLLGSVDLRLRYISDVFVICHRIVEDTVLKGFKYNFFVGYQLIDTKFLPLKEAETYWNGKRCMFNTNEIIMPISATAINFNEVLDIYEKSPTKIAFVSLMKRTYPFLANYNIEGCYDYLKFGNTEKAKKLLSTI